MTDLYDGLECRLFNNGHRFIYDAAKSRAEEQVFTCLCGSILSEQDDAVSGC